MLTLNEQFALREQYQQLNYLKYEIEQYIKPLQLSKQEEIEIAQLPKDGVDSLLFHSFAYRIKGVTDVFYSVKDQEISLFGIQCETINEAFPYTDIELVEENENLQELAIILYESALNNFTNLRFADIIHIILESAEANEIITQIQFPEQILKVFLTSINKNSILKEERNAYFLATLNQAYYYILNKQEVEVFQTIISPSFSKFSPTWVWSNFSEFDYYTQIIDVEKAELLYDLISMGLKLLKISSCTTYYLEGNNLHLYIKYQEDFAAFELFKGPLVTQKQEVDEFKEVFGTLAQFRRFQSGEMRQCIFFEEKLTREELVERIIEELISEHYQIKNYRAISTQSLYDDKYEYEAFREMQEEIYEQLESLRSYIFSVNALREFNFTVSDIILNSVNCEEDVLNGFIMITGNGEWYYSPVGNQLLKMQILTKLLKVIDKVGEFELEAFNTHLKIYFELPGRTVQVNLFAITDADDLIIRQYSEEKADYFKALINAKATQMRLIETLININSGYSEGLYLAKKFIRSQNIPTYCFEPSLADFIGVFNTPPFVELYNRFLQISIENHLPFEEIFKQENLLEDDLQKMVNSAEEIIQHEIEHMQISQIESKNALSVELIELITALPLQKRDLNVEIPELNSGIAYFRQFLKFFTFEEEKKFEFNCQLDEIIPSDRLFKIAIIGNPEGDFFSNMSESLYNQLEVISRSALRWLDRCISGEECSERAIFIPQVSNFDIILSFRDQQIKDIELERQYLTCLKSSLPVIQGRTEHGIEENDTLQDSVQGDQAYSFDDCALDKHELLRQIVPEIIDFLSSRYEVYYNYDEQYLGLLRLKDDENLRIQDLPDELYCRCYDGTVHFDEQEFLEEVITYTGDAVKAVYAKEPMVEVAYEEVEARRNQFYEFEALEEQYEGELQEE